MSTHGRARTHKSELPGKSLPQTSADYTECSGDLPPSSPPAEEKATASKDQTGQASANYRTGAVAAGEDELSD
jgi:hypothetical protein